MRRQPWNDATSPIILTRKPRHHLKNGRWEIEFSLQDLNVNKVQGQVSEELRILGVALNRTEQNRAELKKRASIKARLNGLEAFLREFNRLAIVCLAIDKTGGVSKLSVRALHDFILGVEAALAGQHVVVFESMRDVMEIELLIREFHFEPQRVKEWLQADNATLKKEFFPWCITANSRETIGCQISRFTRAC